jgi:hypothetical protein
MSSNTHIAVAKFRQEGVHEWQSEEGSTDATNIAVALDAQTEATLALAYEQRTANLIALFSEGFAGTGLNYGYLFKEINERLGLD